MIISNKTFKCKKKKNEQLSEKIKELEEEIANENDVDISQIADLKQTVNDFQLQLQNVKKEKQLLNEKISNLISVKEKEDLQQQQQVDNEIKQEAKELKQIINELLEKKKNLEQEIKEKINFEKELEANCNDLVRCLNETHNQEQKIQFLLQQNREENKIALEKK